MLPIEAYVKLTERQQTISISTFTRSAETGCSAAAACADVGWCEGPGHGQELSSAVAHGSSSLVAGFMLVVTSLLDFVSQFAMVRALTAPFIWLGTNSLAVFAGDILLQVCIALL